MVEEILCTEKEYVQSLEDIVEVGMATTIYALHKVPSMWNGSVTFVMFTRGGAEVCMYVCSIKWLLGQKDTVM